MIASPVIDHHFILAQPMDAVNNGKAKTIHYMLGATSEDIFPVAIFPMARSYASSQQKDSYTYFFNRQLPGDNNGAWHSSDLWYWFGTLDNCWRPMEKKDYELSEEMMTYLCHFVSTGNPNNNELIQWNPSSLKDKSVLVIGEEDTKMNKVSTLKLLITSLTNKAVGE